MNRRKFLGAAMAAPLVPFVAAYPGYAQGGVVRGSAALMGTTPPETIMPIDATGADPAAIARLEKTIRELAGPGVVERRAVKAVTTAEHRGNRLGPRD